jgi:hypothetical protein
MDDKKAEGKKKKKKTLKIARFYLRNKKKMINLFIIFHD